MRYWRFNVALFIKWIDQKLSIVRGFSKMVHRLKIKDHLYLSLSGVHGSTRPIRHWWSAGRCRRRAAHRQHPTSGEERECTQGGTVEGGGIR